jgi:non-heme chloroperoxidase
MLDIEEGYGAGVRRHADARLAYVEAGSGAPLVLAHGSLTDLRYWQRSHQLDALAVARRVITPSRRHNHPNPPTPLGGAYSAHDDAADLIELLGALETGPVDLLGHSYGAYGALLTALARPDLVRRLILAEPPIMRWLPLLPAGEGVWEAFERNVWRPIGEAFADGGDGAGLDVTARWYFGRPFSEIESAWQHDFCDSTREWRALTTSADAFPLVAFDDVAALETPTLILSAGRNAGGFNDLIDAQLAALLPNARRVVVPDVSHELFLDAPETMVRTVTDFLQGA